MNRFQILKGEEPPTLEEERQFQAAKREEEKLIKLKKLTVAEEEKLIKLKKLTVAYEAIKNMPSDVKKAIDYNYDLHGVGKVRQL